MREGPTPTLTWGGGGARCGSVQVEPRPLSSPDPSPHPPSLLTPPPCIQGFGGGVPEQAAEPVGLGGGKISASGLIIGYIGKVCFLWKYCGNRCGSLGSGSRPFDLGVESISA